MPNNAKRIRDSLENLKNGVGILGSQHSQLQREAAR